MACKKYELTSFYHAGRLCIIIKSYHLMPHTPAFHNGYVETPKHGVYYDKYYDISCEEPTFAGEWDEFPGRWFIGFDTVHSHDNEATQCYDAVLVRTRTFAEELVVLEEAED